MEKSRPHRKCAILLLGIFFGIQSSIAADISFSVSPSSQSSLNPTDTAGLIARPVRTEKKSVSGSASGGRFGSASGILGGASFPTNSISGEYTLDAYLDKFFIQFRRSIFA